MRQNQPLNTWRYRRAPSAGEDGARAGVCSPSANPPQHQPPLAAGGGLHLLLQRAGQSVQPLLAAELQGSSFFSCLRGFSACWFSALAQLTVPVDSSSRFLPSPCRQFCSYYWKFSARRKETRAALAFGCHLHLLKPLWLQESCSFRLFYLALPS